MLFPLPVAVSTSAILEEKKEKVNLLQENTQCICIILGKSSSKVL
jgi:hypothetical protein